MSEHSEEADDGSGGRMGRAILRGVGLGFPICLIGLTVAVWLITDLDLADSFATALLPGILLGGFAGGFAGLAMTMD
jgi:hypothetical protein